MNENGFDSEYTSENENTEHPVQENAEPSAPAGVQEDAAPLESTPQRVDYTRPAAPYGSYGYIPQQPGNYRPSAAPHPGTQPPAPQNAPVTPQRPPVNPYSAQGRYTPQYPQQQYTQNPYAAPQVPYSAPRPQYTAPAQTPKQPVKPAPKKEKKTSGARIAVIALCCALLGSILGGGIVGFAMHSFYGTDTEISATAPTTEATQAPVSTDPTQAPPVITTDTAGNLAQVYESNVAAIVGIANEGTSYNVFGQVSKTASTGTGFIISADGEILTNFHVVEGAQTLTVTMHDGSTYSAIVLGYEAESDVALLKIEASGLPTVSLGNSDGLNVGDQVAAIGNPLGELTYTMTTGIVSSMDRDVNTDGTPINMMQIDAAINPGNSGGPLFDMNGNVVGITTAKYSGTLNGGATIEGIGFAIPINDVLSILDDLRESGMVPNRAYIGITVNTVAASEAMQTPAGAQVATVTEGSSGANAGLQPGDIITGVDGEEIKSSEDLSKALKSFRAGDSAQLTVFRGGSELTLTISFDAKPSATPTEPAETEPQEPESFNPWDFIFP